MIIWLLYFVLSLVFMVICYITNPIVVLFADENGELPWVLKYWQTWDNAVFCEEGCRFAPSFIQYDWAKHYREYKDSDAYLRSVNRERWYCVCINHNWTFVERIKRYLCGVYWLTRNCSYGFAFYILGLTVSPNLEIRQSENTLFVREVFGDGLTGAWSYKNDAPIFTIGEYTFYWKNYLWKYTT